MHKCITFTSVWFLTLLIHHSFKSLTEILWKRKTSIVDFFVYASCNTLAMQISLLWCKILAGLLRNVSIVHLAMAEVLKMLLEWLRLVFFDRDSWANENRTYCRSDSNLIFPHEHQGSVCLDLQPTFRLFQWLCISVSFGFNKRYSVLIESGTLISHCSVSLYVVCALGERIYTSLEYIRLLETLSCICLSYS